MNNFQPFCYDVFKKKGVVKLIQWVVKAYSFLHVKSKLFHVIMLHQLK